MASIATKIDHATFVATSSSRSLNRLAAAARGGHRDARAAFDVVHPTRPRDPRVARLASRTRGNVLRPACAKAAEDGRGGEIRTPGLLLPKQAR
jgi:hypothetical protein